MDIDIEKSIYIYNSGFLDLKILTKNLRALRGSLVPFTIVNGKTYYYFGIDHNFGHLSDLGGGIDSTDKSIVHTALREYSEETNNLFYNIDIDELNGDRFVIIDKTFVIFHSIDYYKINKNYSSELLNIIENGGNVEIEDIIPIELKQIDKLLSHKIDYLFPIVRYILEYIIYDIHRK